MDHGKTALQLAPPPASSNEQMSLDLDRASKTVRKLRRLLKSTDAAPTPEAVHKLRTHCRRLEAMLHGFPNCAGNQADRLLKMIKPVRRAAGQVRDMDVLIAKAAPLCTGPECEPLIRLLEHLAEMRNKGAQRLRKVVCQRGPKLRRKLKRVQHSLEQNASADAPALSESPAGPQILAAELEHWPKLHRDNLHEFRIRVKELRYMLQFAGARNEQRLESFANVKDTAGDWHDWLELQKVAEQIVNGESDADVLRTIRERTHEKLRAAMTAANALRKQGFSLSEAA